MGDPLADPDVPQEPKRDITLTLTVTVPAATGESEVENAINRALDEPPCFWDDWVVGAAQVTDAVRHTPS